MSSVGYGTRANTGLTVPTGTAENDILLFLLFLGNDPTDITASLPSGYTTLSGYTDGVLVVRQGGNGSVNSRLRLYGAYKRAGASESGTHSWTHSSTGSAAFLGRYSGCVTSGDPTDNPNASAASGSTTAPTSVDVLATSVTTVNNGSMVVYLGATWDGSGASGPPTGTTPTFTERVESFGNAFYVADGALTTAGATGNKACTAQCTDNSWGACLVVLEAAIGGSSSVARLPMVAGKPMLSGRMLAARSWGSAGGSGVGYGNRRRRVLC